MKLRARNFQLALLAISIAGCAARTNAPVPGATPLPAPKPGAGPLVVTARSPYAIAMGPDHNIWFTEYEGDSIGMMTPAGEVMRFPIASDGIAERLTSGPDGALWFTDPKGNRIGRIDVDGKIKYVTLPTADSGPTGITTGPDGMIYFTEHAASRIGRMTVEGSLTEFTLRPKSGPAEIVAGHDGAVYFVEDRAGRIGKISKEGEIHEFVIPSPHSIPSAIATGPDASVYFAEMGAGKIGKMNLDGSFDEYAIPDGRPLGLATGPDGNVWATVPKEHLIYRMTSGGDFLAFHGTELTMPAFITATPDQYLYFSEPNGKIGRIDTNGDIVEFDVAR